MYHDRSGYDAMRRMVIKSVMTAPYTGGNSLSSLSGHWGVVYEGGCIGRDGSPVNRSLDFAFELRRCVALRPGLASTAHLIRHDARVVSLETSAGGSRTPSSGALCGKSLPGHQCFGRRCESTALLHEEALRRSRMGQHRKFIGPLIEAPAWASAIGKVLVVAPIWFLRSESVY